jgi:hypothetical protein
MTHAPLESEISRLTRDLFGQSEGAARAALDALARLLTMLLPEELPAAEDPSASVRELSRFLTRDRHADFASLYRAVPTTREVDELSAALAAAETTLGADTAGEIRFAMRAFRAG